MAVTLTDILANDPEIRDILPQRARGGSSGDRLRGLSRSNGSAYDRSMPIEKRMEIAAKADIQKMGGRRG